MSDLDDRAVVEQVRGATNIVSLVGQYVQLRKAGTKMMGLCPFHGEKAPSFSVSEDRQMFYCFGCNRGGDVFKFLMMIENLEFPEALNQLAEKAGIELPRRSGGRPGASVSDRERARKIHRLAQDFFRRCLVETGEGRQVAQYLKKRGLDGEAAEIFGLGYAPAGWDGLVKEVSRSSIPSSELEKCGLAVSRKSEQGHYDRFRNRITIPIRDPQGNIIAFGGRVNGEPGPRDPKFLNSPETLIYRKGEQLYGLDLAGKAIREQGAAVVVEGYFDVIQVSRAGVTNVVAPLGTALTEGQARLLSRYARRVLISFDPDQAGDEASQRSIHIFLKEGFEVQVVDLPRGEDPDDYIRAHGAEAFAGLLERALPFFEHQLNRSLERHDLDRPGGKLAVIEDVLPFLLSVPEKIKQREYLPLIAQRARVEEGLVLEKLLQMAQGLHRRPAAPGPQATTALQPGIAERRLLALMISYPMVRARALKMLKGHDLGILVCGQIISRMAELTGSGEEVVVPRVHEMLPESGGQRELLAAIAQEPVEANGNGNAVFDPHEEAESCLGAVLTSLLQERLKVVQRRLKDPETVASQDRQRELLEEKMTLLREIALYR